jgi:hypothetical protein
VVTWLAGNFGAPIRHGTIAPRREQRTFNSQKEAVDFAMRLNEVARRSAELYLPGGSTPVGIEIIEQMHDAQKSSQ